MPTLTGSDTKPTDSLTVPTVGGDDGTWGTILNDTTFQTAADYFAWLATYLPSADIAGLTDTQTLTNKTMGAGSIFNEPLWTKEDVTLNGGTVDITYSAFSHKVATLSADTTVTFSSLPTSGRYQYVNLEIVQDATGGWNVTWPAAVEWVNDGTPGSAGAPDLGEAAANEVTQVRLWTRDGGSTIYGRHNKPERINYQTGTSYTLTLTDEGKLIRLNNASAITVTVPPNSTEAYANGAAIALHQYGAGTVTVAEGAGVTVNSKGSNLSLAAQHSTATLVYQGSDVWLLTGDLA